MDKLFIKVGKGFHAFLIAYFILFAIVWLIIESTCVYAYLHHGHRIRDLETIGIGLAFLPVAGVCSLFISAISQAFYRVRPVPGPEEIEAARRKLRGPRPNT